VFCEHPAYLEGEAGRLIDFWVNRGRHTKFWVLNPVEPEQRAIPKSAHGVTVQILRRADLVAFDRRIDNWSKSCPTVSPSHGTPMVGYRRRSSIAWKSRIEWSASRRRFSLWTLRACALRYSSYWQPARSSRRTSILTKSLRFTPLHRELRELPGEGNGVRHIEHDARRGSIREYATQNAQSPFAGVL
jgi:hypothetical protein